MKAFDEMVQDIVREKLNNEVIEKVIEEKLEKAVSEACDNIFKWSGGGKELIEEKLKEIIVPAIERCNFADYEAKLDIVLTDIVNNTAIADNKKVLKAFSGLMSDVDCKKIKLSEIFNQYRKFVAENVNTSGLEPNCEDGEPSYEEVEVRLRVKREEDKWHRRLFEYATVALECEHDPDDKLSFTLKLNKWNRDNKWELLLSKSVVDINSLRNISDFELLIMRLYRANAEIVIDTEDDEDWVTPEETPEWNLS